MESLLGLLQMLQIGSSARVPFSLERLHRIMFSFFSQEKKSEAEQKPISASSDFDLKAKVREM